MNDSKPFTPQPSCADATEPGMLSVQEALHRMRAALTPLQHSEKCALRQSLGRVLAEPICSSINVPSHTNSAMDGYALAADSLPQTGTACLRVIGTAWAGRPFAEPVGVGECVRIMTGASMPYGTDTVVMQERAELQGEHVRILSGEQAGQNVRMAGEDLAAGETVLLPGRVIMPPELGLLASLGVAEVSVLRRLRVAFFSTGDELRSIGEPLSEGQIYDSNRYTLYGMITRLGVEVIDMGVVRDDRAALTQAFTEAAACADVLITSGGVSVGEADFTKEVLSQLGDIQFWKIAMKPGRPLAFGRIQRKAFFGLPGNPVAVMVTFYQFVQPLLFYLQGRRTGLEMPTLTARSTAQFRKKPGRAEFPRGVLTQADNGEWTVAPSGKQGSGVLRSMSEGNCFVLLSEQQGTIAPGDWVTVQPFVGLM